MHTIGHAHPMLGGRAFVRACLVVLALAAILAAATPTLATTGNTIIYVVPGGTGGGTSWDDGKDLAAALSGASSNSELWVKAGTYKPTTGTDRTATFALKSGVAVYGGFAGTETTRGRRNWRANVTILSGDLGGGSRSLHVVTGSGTNDTAVLDGFTITGGNANGNYPDSAGGGIYNYQGRPTLTNLIISGNSAWNGGGMYNDWASTTLTNIVFTGNTALVSGGGLFHGWDGGNPTLTNVTFCGNSAWQGGGIYVGGGNPRIRNSILWGDPGGEIDSVHPHASVWNSTIWGSGGSGSGWNAAYGTDGGGNLDKDPLFVDCAHGNLRLQAGSPAIDSGNNDYVAGVSSDLDDHVRIAPANGTVDMGAYEYGACLAANPPTLYVNALVAGVAIGDSWANAYPTLSEALTEANVCASVTQIWVAQGTYKPDTTGLTDARSATFALKNNLAIYGGFTGTETTLSQRDWRTNVTTLSGDLNGDDGANFANNGDNSYHVVTGSGTDATATLDGFTITAGNARNTASPYTCPESCGGGMYNYGGGVTLTNVTFSGNSANYGGGMSNYSSSPTLTNVTFSGNSADSAGGGMYNEYGSPTLTNVTFSGNTTAHYGGGMFNEYQSNPTLTNVTFSGNSAEYGGGMIDEYSSPTIRNSILWGDSGGEIYNAAGSPTVSYSIVQGGYSGTGNLNQDPLFVTAVPSPAPSTGGNLHLGAGSPAIDRGYNSYVPVGMTTDLDSHPRIMAASGGTVDMGAYEVQDTTPPVISVTCNGQPCSVGWYNANVSVVWTVTESESRVLSSTGCDPTSITADTTTDGTTLTCSATSVGGTSDPVSVTIKRDATKPTISAAATSQPNSNGWYNGPVTVRFTCNDGLSGIPTGACPSDQVLSAEGSAVSSTAQTVADAAGNVSDPSNVVTVKIDTSKPSISITTPAANAVYLLGQTVNAGYTCADGGSGVATCVGTVANGSRIDTSTLGAKTFTVNASDKAGNTNSATVSYVVGYGVSYVSPLLAPPSVNQLYPTSIGTTRTSVKWKLTDAAGTPVTAAGTVTGIAYKLNGSCSGFTTDPTGATAAAMDGTNPKYDALQKAWVYNWLVPGRGCYTLFMTLNGGQMLILRYNIH
ncbi:MAG: choice-of-anchor Q domain-containing protein [Anaerolineae bacterium]